MESKEIFYPLFGENGYGCRCRRTPNGERSDVGSENGCPSPAPCTTGSDPLSGASLAMVYSPEQAFEMLYEPDEGLVHGTIFQALDKPFFGDGRKC